MPILNLTFDAREDKPGGRYIVALRGDTRQKLDELLLGDLMGTGIGRSAFICAAVDAYEAMTPEEQDAFEIAANVYEQTLPR